MISVGIITVSDRAANGVYDDMGGPALQAAAAARGWTVVGAVVVPDELPGIQAAIQAFAQQDCGLILTTGGTGITGRDVTPEAVRGIMRTEVPGFGEVMRAQSQSKTPNALLSRCLAAVVNQSLVVALPGKPQGALECLGFVADAIPHAVKLLKRQPTSC
ncbi:MAG: molybdenum cofactor synthesis domain-containing protein [Verrucomicrobiales bacterium]